jgi:xanthine dehydrogenase small subunit
MVGDLKANGQGVDYKAVNSCIQLLPSLDGKSIKTVESLKKADGTLHPVQKAMVDCHGSQCGFCTPGIVMSLVNLVQVNTPSAATCAVAQATHLFWRLPPTHVATRLL